MIRHFSEKISFFVKIEGELRDNAGMKILGSLLILILLSYGAFTLYLYLRQRSILYETSHTAPKYHGFYLGKGDERIWVEVFHPGKAAALLYFPGNAEAYWEDPQELAAGFPEMTLYFPHYRGYGASSGSPSEQTLKSDALRLYDHIRSRHAKIVALGRSLGSGVALHLASRRPLAALILVTPYDSILALARERYGIFPVSWILKDPYRSDLDAPRIAVPTLILLAQKDRVVPLRRSEALIRSFRKIRPEVRILPDATHGDIVEHPAYLPTIRDFLHRAGV